MAIRTSEAEWRGDLKGGQGEVKLGSGAFSGSYSFHSRFEDGKGANPEELIAAAHAACFSMALSAMLAEVGHPPAKIHTAAKVYFGQCQATLRFLESTLPAENRGMAGMEINFEVRRKP
jgi:lipoyl-dependent peroxiredoxin